MYRKIEGNQRMTSAEAEELYPDEYIAMQMDSRDTRNTMGMVLFVGDSRSELLKLILNMDNPINCGVKEGANLEKGLGGIEING